MVLSIGILNGITGTGRASDQLPAQQDIVAQYQISVTADDKQWIDVNASGAYEVEEGHSVLFDNVLWGVIGSVLTVSGDFVMSWYANYNNTFFKTILAGDTFIEGVIRYTSGHIMFMSIDNTQYTFTNVPVNNRNKSTLTRVGNQLTFENGGVSQILTSKTDDMIIRYIGHFGAQVDEFVGNLWDIQIEDSTGVVFSNFLAQDSTDMKMLSEVGPDVQFVNSTYPIVEKSVLYGHEWANYSEDVPDNIELWDLPPTATGEGWSDNGDGTWTCDGTQSGSSLVTIGGGVLLPLGGSWGVTLTVLSVDDNSGRVSLASGDLTTPPADTTGVYDGSGILTTGGGNINLIAEVGFAGTVRPSWQSIVTGKIPADPTSPNLDILGNTLTNPGTPQKNIQVTGYAGTFDGTAYLTASHLTGSEIVVDSTGTSTPSVSAGKIDFTIGWCSFVELSNGDTYIIESNPASLQDTVYNIADTNHGILTSATLPFFTTEIEGSKLFADGFDNVGGSTGLVPARADGLSATGQPLTNQPTEFIGDYCLFDAPLSVSFYDAAVVAGIDTNLYLAGAAIGLTADAWILLASNPLFFGAVQNILVMYNDTQSGDTLDQINDYLGI